uniref:Replication factor A C-terminal domain-containing protein n=1 Tax=Lactuca sativa TaxID=4236 RepID=A0A9R1XI07_LACSA|nr:hypothetical protein LSAT_V11C400191950 [Lactuca sativa]
MFYVPIVEIPFINEAHNDTAVHILSLKTQHFCKYKFSLTLNDTTDTISTIIFDTSCQKLLNSTLQNLIANNNTINRKTLPRFITEQKGQTKNMSIHILKASAQENLRFIIVYIESSKPTSQTDVPTTRSTLQQNTLESRTFVTRAARALSYNTTDIHINHITIFDAFMFSSTCITFFHA